MKLNYLQPPYKEWNKPIPKSKQYPRHFEITEDIEITLSDGYIITIKKGTIWDGASIPYWLHWLMKPIDEGAIGDAIHDYLWIDKQGQFKYFGYNIYKARKFADDERNKWRKALAPKKVFKNWVTHRVLRLIGGFFYSQQLKIPN